MLAQALLECGNDVDAAIRRLSDLRLTAPRPAAAAGAAAAAAATEQQSEAAAAVQQQGDTADADRAAQATLSDARPAPQGAPAPEEALQTAGDWVDFLVQEMAVSRSVDDARARAAGVLQRFEAFVSKRVAADAAAGADSSGTGGVGASGSDGRQQPQLASCGGVDHPSSQRLVEALRENGILKRAVQIQAAKLAEKEKLEEQVAGLQHAVARYQEQLASLEMHNYSLSLHLQRAAGGSGMNLPGQRLPDIF